MKMVNDDIIYVGVDDLKVDLFEGMYKVPCGVSYNSYLIKDEKIAVMDSVDINYGKEWLKNLEEALNGACPDYLVVQHMEPDHSASVKLFCERYPKAVVVGNQKTFVMLGEYFGEGFPANALVVKEAEELSLGKHILKFIFAPMVHWPEVMFTYDKTAKILFSADAFGKFGALSKGGEWIDEARRYYIGIVGKYGVQVKAVLAKVGAYQIDKIAPLHGPVLEGQMLTDALTLYVKWSGYEPEEEGVLVAYSSVYGHTRLAAELLADEIKGRKVKVEIKDLARADWAECVALAFKYSKLVIATTTYNADIFPAAREFIDRLVERNYQKRKVAFIENGTWAPVCANKMKAKFEACKDIEFAENAVKIKSALSEDSKSQIIALAEELTK